MGTHRFSSYQWALHGTLVVLAALVLILVQETRELREALAGSEPPGLQVGQTLEPIPAIDLEGNSETLMTGNPGRESLLFVFTTVCPICIENQGQWRSLYEKAESSYDIVGVSLNAPDVTARYRDEYRLPYPVFIPEDIEGFALGNGILGVPMTIHIGRDGQVRQFWPGLLSDDSIEQLMTYSEGIAIGS